MDKWEKFKWKVERYVNWPLTWVTEEPQKVSIKGDGNCLFRTLSYILYGNQQYHLAIRQAIVKHMLMHKELFAMHVEGDYDSHLRAMYKTGEWGTDAEIIAFCHLYKKLIAVTSKYGCQTFRPEEVEKGIKATNKEAVLVNLSNNHFSPVKPGRKIIVDSKARQIAKRLFSRLYY